MSTVFYGYKIKKQDLWTVVRRLRLLVTPRKFEDFEGDIKAGRISFHRVKEVIEIDIQLVPVDEEHYVFRVKEIGYELFNKIPGDIERFSYDDRTDGCDNTVTMEEMEAIESLLQDRIYLIVPIRSMS